MEEYKEIPIAKIDTAKQMIRDKRDDDYVTELAADIKIQGLHHPIVVRHKDDGIYQLLAGFHRLEAYKRNGKKTIPAHIETKTDIPVELVALSENVIRRDLSLEEECQIVTKLNTVLHLSPSQICDRLGKSRAWIDRRLMATNLPEKIRIALWEGRISLTIAEMLGIIPDDGIRNQLLNQIEYGKLTASQAKDLIAVYESAPNIQDAVSQGLETAQKVEAPQERMQRCMSCSTPLPLSQLMPVWVCTNGCRPRPDPAKEDKGETK